MQIINVNEGTKVDYDVSGTKITFNDELMLNLAKYQNVDDVNIDICKGKNGNLTNGLQENGAYVAQVVVPGFEYTETTKDDETVLEQQDLDMDKVILRLWNV